jgi:hypothetical protein
MGPRAVWHSDEGGGSYGFEMLGDEVPFTMKTRYTWDFPPAVAAVVFVLVSLLFFVHYLICRCRFVTSVIRDCLYTMYT